MKKIMSLFLFVCVCVMMNGGSTSKLLVWVSVMQQVERGNIDLDTDIREYLPARFLTKLQYEDEKITMVNLMNHNAGFQESFYENQECVKDALYDNLDERKAKIDVVKTIPGYVKAFVLDLPVK